MSHNVVLKQNQRNTQLDHSQDLHQHTQPELETIFLNAINNRDCQLSQKRSHIYLEKFDIPQIALFDTLINRFPFVTASHKIVNQTIAQQLAHSSHPVLIDVGIGRGFQVEKLLSLLFDNQHIEKLTIIGIEPFEEAIVHAQSMLSSAVTDLPFTINFVPIVSLIEDLALQQIKQALPSHYDKLLINASLTAHHIPTRALRLDFFEKMYQLSPDGLLLTEPDIDHMEDQWGLRVQNARHHYSTIFELIDQMQNINLTERNALKSFFAREVNDVVGNPENQRFERHEPCEQWLSYLHNSGFLVQQALALTLGEVDDVLDVIPVTPGCLKLGYNSIGILSVMYATRQSANLN